MTMPIAVHAVLLVEMVKPANMDLVSATPEYLMMTTIVALVEANVETVKRVLTAHAAAKLVHWATMPIAVAAKSSALMERYVAMKDSANAVLVLLVTPTIVALVAQSALLTILVLLDLVLTVLKDRLEILIIVAHAVMCVPMVKRAPMVYALVPLDLLETPITVVLVEASANLVKSVEPMANASVLLAFWEMTATVERVVASAVMVKHVLSMELVLALLVP